MARILVAGADDTLAERQLVRMLIEQIRGDGHDAGRVEGSASKAIDEGDAVVAVLDRCSSDVAALVAYAHAQNKPVLGLATRGSDAGALGDMARLVPGERVDDWLAALPQFYEEVRPFAGRVVRDRIPELVREAGHDVAFRQLTAEEKPRFLKQKVANEAQELLRADMGKEREEVADVLEALEAFIAARGFERDDLRRIKEHKRKQRGGFERGFVVEATTGKAQPQEEPVVDAGPPPAPRQEPGAIDFEYGEEPVEEVEAPEDLAKGRQVKGEFFEI